MPLFTSPGLLVPDSIAMAPTLIGSPSAFYSSSGLTSYSMPHTVPAGANCLALFIGACRSDLTDFALTSVTWNGVPLQALADCGGFSFSRGISATHIGGLANPGAGTHSIVVTLSAAPHSCALYAVNLAGVDTAAMAHGTAEESSIIAHLATLSGSIAVTEPVLIFGGMSLGNPPGPASFTPGAGVSELAQGTASGASASRHFFGYRRESVAGTYGFAATCTQSSVVALAAVAFKGI